MKYIHGSLRALVAVVLLVALSRVASAQTTITYTDRNGDPTNSVEVPADWAGRVSFRVEVDALPNPFAMPTHSVLVEDSTAQMSPFCLDLDNGMTASATSEVLTAAPLVTLTGRAFSETGCAGVASVPSNPILVRFVPEPPFFTEPSQP